MQRSGFSIFEPSEMRRYGLQFKCLFSVLKTASNVLKMLNLDEFAEGFKKIINYSPKNVFPSFRKRAFPRHLRKFRQNDHEMLYKKGTNMYVEIMNFWTSKYKLMTIFLFINSPFPLFAQFLRFCSCENKLRPKMELKFHRVRSIGKFVYTS